MLGKGRLDGEVPWWARQIATWIFWFVNFSLTSWPHISYLKVAGIEPDGKFASADLWLGKSSDQDIQGLGFCHLKETLAPPIRQDLTKLNVKRSVFVLAHPPHVVSIKNIWSLRIRVREFPKMLDKALQLVRTHPPPSHMADKFVDALFAEEVLHLPVVAHLPCSPVWSHLM